MNIVKEHESRAAQCLEMGRVQCSPVLEDAENRELPNTIREKENPVPSMLSEDAPSIRRWGRPVYTRIRMYKESNTSQHYMWRAHCSATFG